MIDIDPRFLGDLAERLDFWPGTQWTLTIFPFWMVVLAPLILAFGPYLFARIFIEFQSPKLHKQYRGLWPGDLFFGSALGLAVAGMAFYASPVISHFWHSIFWNMVVAFVCLVALFGLWAVELNVAIKNRKLSDDKRDPKAYTVYQLFTPTSLVHRYIMFLYAYFFMKVGVVAMCTSAVPLWMKLAMALLFLAWAYCALWRDNTQIRPNLADVHPTSRAWFTGWIRKSNRTQAPQVPTYPTRRAGDHTIAMGQPVSPAGSRTGYRTGSWDDTEPMTRTAPHVRPAGAASSASEASNTTPLPDFPSMDGDGHTRPIDPRGATGARPGRQRREGSATRRPNQGGSLPDFPVIPGDQ